jgi:hypothetical protein
VEPRVACAFAFGRGNWWRHDRSVIHLNPRRRDFAAYRCWRGRNHTAVECWGRTHAVARNTGRGGSYDVRSQRRRCECAIS